MNAPETKHTPKRGRPFTPDSERLSERFEVRLSKSQRAKLDRLGGAKWLQSAIDRANEPPG